MIESIAVIIIIQVTCITAITVNRLFNCIKNSNWCNKVHVEG